MDVKPFSLQSPEAIAKEYGGDKRKIAQAIQLGLVDPTAGVVAGMFIDRIRSAAMQENAGPIQTVAQQTFAPPAPPPQAMPPGPPQDGPPQGGPPQGGGQPEGMGPTMVPPNSLPQTMAAGGLAALDVPDNMYDGYATGGLVAFAGGSPGVTVGPTPAPTGPVSMFGHSTDPRANMESYLQMLGPQDETYTRMFEEEAKQRLDPAGRKRARKRDMWEALAQIGFGMAASKSPTFLGAAGEAANAAVPAMAERRKERRAEERESVRDLLNVEGQRRQQRGEAVKAGFEGSRFATEQVGQQRRLDEELKARRELTAQEIASREAIARMQESGAMERTRMQVQGSLAAAGMSARAQRQTDTDDLIGIYYEQLKGRVAAGTLKIPGSGKAPSNSELRAMAANMAYKTKNEAGLMGAYARMQGDPLNQALASRLGGEGGSQRPQIGPGANNQRGWGQAVPVR
jgi:hypothetical protein